MGDVLFEFRLLELLIDRLEFVVHRAERLKDKKALQNLIDLHEKDFNAIEELHERISSLKRRF